MCFGGATDNSAEISRQADDARNTRIREGTNRINQIFGGPMTESYTRMEPYQLPTNGEDGMPGTGTYTEYRPVQDTRQAANAPGQFTNDFYSGLGKSYMDYYSPELDNQYKNAQKQATFRYANQGNLDSGSSNETFANLGKHYYTQKGELANRALGAEQDMRGQVEQNRADLIAQLEAGAGLESTAQSALARANSLTAPPAYSPLGDVFSQFTGALANSSKLQAQGYQGLPFMNGGSRSPSQAGAASVSTVR